MNNTQLQTLKGFRDFLPSAKWARDLVGQKLVQTFQLFGFQPLETPTLEYASLLTGKYGTEADKLLYLFEDKGGRQVGLRYDQTVPTARVLVQYQNDLPKFFRRYQFQNVFRADKPQAGRYREFSQCDIDIFGSTSPVADAEILACTYQAVKNIGFDQVILKINDRQTLMDQITPFANAEVTVFSIIQSVDKLDKMSKADVVKELTAKGLIADQAEKLLTQLEQCRINANLDQIVALTQQLGVPANALVFSPTLARGLDYYTGMIFEVVIPDYANGSCGGGGRYDNLIEQLSGQAIPAVGMAFGFDRLVEAAEQLKVVDAGQGTTQVLVTLFDESTQADGLKLAHNLRSQGVATEVYPQLDKLGKQFKLADQKNIPFVAIIGEAELAKNQVTLKNMQTSEQETLSMDAAVAKLKSTK